MDLLCVDYHAVASADWRGWAVLREQSLTYECMQLIISRRPTEYGCSFVFCNTKIFTKIFANGWAGGKASCSHTGSIVLLNEADWQ